tara:strand:+ start:93 stop:263 length:171 start_codon:yes stop_codon:yes gene_type:complete
MYFSFDSYDCCANVARAFATASAASALVSVGGGGVSGSGSGTGHVNDGAASAPLAA